MLTYMGDPCLLESSPAYRSRVLVAPFLKIAKYAQLFKPGYLAPLMYMKGMWSLSLLHTLWDGLCYYGTKENSLSPLTPPTPYSRGFSPVL